MFVCAAFVMAALAAAPPSAFGQELPLQLTWVDRTGKPVGTVGPPGSYRGPDVTSSGSVAVHQHDRLGGDIWLFDAKGQTTRLTTDATGTQENSSPIFSPDGNRVVFASLRNGRWGLYMKGVTGGREELLVESGSRKMPMAWSPDGQFIIYWVASGAGQWVIPIKNPSAARPLHDRPNSHAQISPDGKWVAFNSLNQIYVKPFPSGEGQWKISTDTGAFARWRGDSKELYFLSRISFGQMMAVEINATGTTLQPGKPRVLFDSRYVNLGHPSNYHTYSVAADGERFLIPRIAPYSLTVFDRSGKVVRTLDQGVYTSAIWSPDGTRVAVIKDTRQLWVMDGSTGKGTLLAPNEAEDVVTGLVWSPDGRQLAYHVRKIDRELIHKVSADGGAPELLFRLPGFGLSLTDWSPDGKYLIYYSQQLAGNRVFALPVTPEPKPIEIMKSDLPINGARISPDGRLIAYQSTESAESPKQGIYVRTLDLAAAKTGDTAQRVDGDPSFGQGLGVSWKGDSRELYYMAPKYAVMAVEVTASPALQMGKPRQLFTVPDATNDAQGIGFPWGNVTRDGQRVVYSVAPKGASLPADPISQLAILDRSGKVLRRVGPAGRYGQPALSPDGTRIATRWFDTFAPGGKSDIWVIDVASGKTTPISNDLPADFAPMWSPDGKQIYYVSARAGGYQGIYRKAADGTGGEPELIYRYEPGAPVQLRDISSDGQRLLFNSGGVILVVPLSGDAKTRKATEVSREEFLVNGGVLSPDGKFLAYTSNETETFELYVRPFDGATGAVSGNASRVSKEGAGGLMVWRSDGRELYFMDTEPDLKVMSVDVATSPGVQVGAPKVLFEVPGDAQGDLGTTRYISRDGQRFVFVLPAEK
jgi:Tol biopolymer transport system component